VSGRNVQCGAGALRANLCEALARCGAGRLSVIDRDRVEPHNLSTQPYSRAEVGVFKARALANALFRALGTNVEAHVGELNADNCHKLLRGSELVVDCFDNGTSRQFVPDDCRARSLERRGFTATLRDFAVRPFD
jgi:molybdopterin/thiamine biosynthesis adenylyltransferase